MAVQDLEGILFRIEAATPESPIAVFALPKSKLEAVFAATVRSQERMRTARNLIGVFNNGMTPNTVRGLLRKGMRA